MLGTGTPPDLRFRLPRNASADSQTRFIFGVGINIPRLCVTKRDRLMAYVTHSKPCPKYVDCTMVRLCRRDHVSIWHRNDGGAFFLKPSWLVPLHVRRLGAPDPVAHCKQIVARLLVKPRAQRAPHPTQIAPALGRRFLTRMSASSVWAETDCLRGGVCA